MRTLLNKILVKYPLDKNSIILGFKKAYSLPTLPYKLEKIYYHILFRILRVIGGGCLFLVITGYSLKLPYLVQYIVIPLSIFQTIQMWLIFMIKGIYMTYYLIYKKKEFEVRN